MRLDELFTTLLELDFHDRWPLLDLLAKHKGKKRFIHFTQPLKPAGGGQRSPDQFKFGVNPIPNQYWRKSGDAGGMTVKMHNDPSGIYFYPIDWIFSDHERVRSGDQFALNWPRWYVIDIDWSAPGMVLSEVTWGDVEALADRNGWRNLLDDVRNEPERFKNAFPYWMKADNPAHVMWCLLDHFQRSKTISWTKAFKGVAYIYDDNNSIIYSHEPHQLLVLDPKIMKTVDSGDQATEQFQTRDANSYQYWTGALAKLFKRLRGSRGGEIVYRKKQASYHLEEGGCIFDITFEGSWKTGVSMRYSWGRAVAEWFGEFKTYPNLDELAEAIEREMDKAIALSKRKQDLLFKPVVTPEIARKFIEMRIAGDKPVTFKTEIFNEKRPYYRLAGTYTTKIGEIDLTTEYTAIGSRDSFGIGVEIKINGQSAGKGNGSVEGDEPLDETLPKLKSQLDRAHDMILSGRGPDSGSLYKFRSEGEFNAFLGWVAAHANLNTETTLNNYLSDHLPYYEQYPHKDDLEQEIGWVFRKSMW